MCKTAPALITFRNEANELAPNRRKTSDGSCPSAEHSKQNPTSDHEPNAQGWSRAYDLDEKLGLAGLDPDKPLLPLVSVLIKDPRTKYVIYERRIYFPDGTSRAYNGVNAHDKHLHLSIKNECVLDTSPWHVASAFVFEQEEDEEDMSKAQQPRLVLYANDGGYGWYSVFGNVGWYIGSPTALDLFRSVGLESVTDAGGEPLQGDWLEGVALMDGPCKNRSA